MLREEITFSVPLSIAINSFLSRAMVLGLDLQPFPCCVLDPSQALSQLFLRKVQDTKILHWLGSQQTQPWPHNSESQGRGKVTKENVLLLRAHSFCGKGLPG